VDEGTTFSQSPACGREEERAKAFDLKSGAEVSRRLKEASSILRDKGRCLIGTSISSIEIQSGLSAASARADRESGRWTDGSGIRLRIWETSICVCVKELT
jgi:hypothetical protein